MKRFSMAMTGVMLIALFAIMGAYENDTINTWQVCVMFPPAIAGFTYFAYRAGLFG